MKKMIIIGGGVAGLCAGSYARMNGYETVIFELHDKPGGLCTSWRRKGFVVDGCIHWLVGSGEGQALNDFWKELGALGQEYINHGEFARVVAPDGKTLIFYTDIDRFEKHLLELAPGDAKTIREFTGAARRFCSFKMPVGKPQELRSTLDKIMTVVRMGPDLIPFLKWSKISVQDFAKKFNDPFLSRAFPVFFDMPDFPMVALLLTLVWMHQKNAGYPVGGSLEFARGLEKRYLGLGGEIKYKARVEKILVENGRAVGVRLTDGSERRADWVVSAADGRATIFDMLEGKYIDDEIRGYYDKLGRFPGLIQASFGVDRDMSAEPGFVFFTLPEPVELGGIRQKVLAVHNYSYDHTMAPAGKAVVVVRMEGDYDYWKGLSADREKYETEKQKVGDALMGMLEARYPGISEQVEMVDVSTPLTTERYTGNWRGSMEGWLITTKTLTMSMKRSLPGLDNFYMIGQWVAPGGGLPGGLITGREIAQVICARDGKKFQAVRP